MIEFNQFELDNHLKVIVHEDNSTPFAVMNILYNVGARDEDPEKTGFAHLFEHLMFEGTPNIPDFDKHIERAGGRNNAFTNNDITNYYDIVPAENIETLFWLESDRMAGLDFKPQPLELQKKVVSEEFKEHYINQPYGDVWHKIRNLAYKDHPYRWPTIGKDLKHIKNATLEDVTSFFYKHYHPGNAILVITGNVKTVKIKELALKWFGNIPANNMSDKIFPKEQSQNIHRTEKVEANVPLNAIYKAYHMCRRTDSAYNATDLLSDILSKGQSSRLYQSLIKEQKLFSSVEAFILGSIDNGLIVIEGMLSEGVSMKAAEQSIVTEVEKVKESVGVEELQKVKNKIMAEHAFGRTKVLNKAMELAYFELLGNADLINDEIKKYEQVTVEDINHNAREILRDTNCSTIYYYKKTSLQ